MVNMTLLVFSFRLDVLKTAHSMTSWSVGHFDIVHPRIVFLEEFENGSCVTTMFSHHELFSIVPSSINEKIKFFINGRFIIDGYDGVSLMIYIFHKRTHLHLFMQHFSFVDFISVVAVTVPPILYVRDSTVTV